MPTNSDALGADERFAWWLRILTNRLNAHALRIQKLEQRVELLEFELEYHRNHQHESDAIQL